MHWTELPLNEQIFTHIDNITGKNTVYAATSLRLSCDRAVASGLTQHLGETPIDERYAQLMMKVRGIERPRLRRAKKTTNYLPFLYCTQPDGTQLLIDGSHTYIARYMKGHKWALAYVVPQSVWEHFVVEGLPEESEASLLKSSSGVPT